MHFFCLSTYIYAPAIYNGGGHIASPLSVHTYVPYVRKMVSGRFHTQVYNHKIQVKFDYGQNPPIIIRVIALDLSTKNGFRAISFKYIGELDSYFIHRYVIIKYRSSSIMDIIHRLLSELWPFVKWQCPIYANLAIAGASVSHGHISSFYLSKSITSIPVKVHFYVLKISFYLSSTFFTKWSTFL